MDLSIVIPCRNAAHTIGATVEGLVSQTWPSSGPSEKRIAELSMQLKMLKRIDLDRNRP
jgi:hypothetical protein